MTAFASQHHNLPAQISSFIGREEELEEIARLLGQQRLITLSGSGGAGKTRLALRAAEVALDRFGNGVWLAGLAALTIPELVLDTVAKVLGVPEDSTHSPLDTLCAFVGEKHLLLILDNCEHLLAECARVLTVLLAHCPRLMVLATSREPLGIGGERVVRVPPLHLPDVAQSLAMEQLLDYDGVRLFVERARAAEPSFQLTSVSAAPVVEICRRLDGIPLALELAAVRVRGMGVAYLGARLDDRFRLLTGGDRSGEPRQRTLLAMVDWSYALLSERERVVLRRLCIFRGGFAAEAAEAICAGDNQAQDKSEQKRAALSAADVLDDLTRLVDKSLVQLDQDSGRYRLLETIHLYGLAQLDTAGETKHLNRQHFAYYLRLAEASAALVSGPEQEMWLARLELEHDNMRAALSWAIQAGRGDEAARLALGLWHFWRLKTYQREGLRWLEQVLALGTAHPLPAALRPRLYNALGVLANLARHFDRASAYQTEALRLWTAADNRAGMAQALLDMGYMHFDQVDLAQTRRFAAKSLPLAEGTGDQRLIAAALLLSAIAATHSDLGLMFSFDADTPMDGSQLLDVIPLLERSLAIWRELGDSGSEAGALALLGMIYLGIGEYERAKPLLAESARLHVRLGDFGNMNGTLVGLMNLAAATCDAAETARDSARVYGVLRALTERIGVDMSPWDASEPAQRLMRKLRAVIGRDGFEQALAEGKQLTTAGLLAVVDRITAPGSLSDSADAPQDLQRSQGSRIALPSPATTPASGPHDALTPREREVLRLVARGMTNAQVAQALVVTSRTINAHLTAIYAKLGVTSRGGAIRYAVGHQLD